MKYREIYKDYLSGKLRLKKYQIVGVFFLVVVISGFFGWIWEEILANIFDGVGFYAKGGNFLPWINLYAIGAVVIIATTSWFKKYPWLVFVVGFFATGLLELLAGWLVYTFGNGTRYWNYLNDVWGVGSINGFVCPASATAFGLAALLLIYVVLPWCIYLSQKMVRKKFLIIATILFVLVMTDEITNLTFKNLGMPTAMDFYRSIGLKYPTDS